MSETGIDRRSGLFDSSLDNGIAFRGETIALLFKLKFKIGGENAEFHSDCLIWGIE